jgi:hypothetical protein
MFEKNFLDMVPQPPALNGSKKHLLGISPVSSVTIVGNRTYYALQITLRLGPVEIVNFFVNIRSHG